mgnify:CR=1 FL=1|jgi:N-acetylneuraminate synthase
MSGMNEINFVEPELIAEAGVNHEGNLNIAKQMIVEAAKLGLKYIKFQSYKKETITAKESPSYWDLHSEPSTSQYELFSKYDSFGIDDYYELANLSVKNDIEFMTTCFDLEMVRNLDPLLKRYKIASADLTNRKLVEEIASKSKPILLSTGASTIQEIEESISWIKKIDSHISITLLHCVLNYPTKIENANLSRINILKKEFPECKIGYSDHTSPKDSFKVIPYAILCGATIIEKHFTLDKSLQGNDHYHSFDPKDFHNLKREINLGIKIFAYSESSFIDLQNQARKYARRGIYASSDINMGESITESNVIALRPTLDKNGYSADEFHKIIGKRAKIRINAGDPILEQYLN